MIEVDQRSKRRGCFYPDSFRTLPSLNSFANLRSLIYHKFQVIVVLFTLNPEFEISVKSRDPERPRIQTEALRDNFKVLIVNGILISTLGFKVQISTTE